MTIPHGYTMAELDTAARKAAATFVSYVAGDISDLYHAAWSAIIDHIYSPDPNWQPWSLVQVGKWGILDMEQERRHHTGTPSKNAEAGPGAMPAFAKYWYAATAPAPEDLVVDRAAIRQVWAALTDGERAALTVHAAYGGDYHAASAALGRTYASVQLAVSAARRHAHRLWFDLEHPPRRRIGTPYNRRLDRGRNVKPCGTTAAADRHRRNKEPLCPECKVVDAARRAAHYQRRKAQRVGAA